MELFLNFVWLLLFVPAWWVWRRNACNLSSSRCFLSLVCALVILFPVISATDDLHAAPQAMEESTSTKRTLKHANVDKAQNHSPVLQAHVSTAAAFYPSGDVSVVIQEMPARAPRQDGGHVTRDRAPPVFFS